MSEPVFEPTVWIDDETTKNVSAPQPKRQPPQDRPPLEAQSLDPRELLLTGTARRNTFLNCSLALNQIEDAFTGVSPEGSKYQEQAREMLKKLQMLVLGCAAER